jgi:hypothetical protein
VERLMFPIEGAEADACRHRLPEVAAGPAARRGAVADPAARRLRLRCRAVRATPRRHWRHGSYKLRRCHVDSAVAPDARWTALPAPVLAHAVSVGPMASRSVASDLRGRCARSGPARRLASERQTRRTQS